LRDGNVVSLDDLFGLVVEYAQSCRRCGSSHYYVEPVRSGRRIKLQLRCKRCDELDGPLTKREAFLLVRDQRERVPHL
jgi:hypothetical protein